MSGPPNPKQKQMFFVTTHEVRKFGVPNFCDTTVTDDDDDDFV